jgi:hypothetical protein
VYSIVLCSMLFPMFAMGKLWTQQGIWKWMRLLQDRSQAVAARAAEQRCRWPISTEGETGLCWFIEVEPSQHLGNSAIRPRRLGLEKKCRILDGFEDTDPVKFPGLRSDKAQRAEKGTVPRALGSGTSNSVGAVPLDKVRPVHGCQL